VFRGARSRLFRIRLGFSQGSVLGPGLFILHVDDLARTLPQGIIHSLYADDLSIWSSYPDPLNAAVHAVQKAIDLLEQWSSKWHLSVKPENVNIASSTRTPTKLRINLSLL